MFEAAQARGPAGQAARRPTLELARRRARGAIRRALRRPSRICGRGGHRGDGEGRRRRGAAARRLLLLRESDRRRRSRSCASTACRSRVATDCNPGTSPLTSLLLALNMARDPVRAHGRRVPRRRTRNAARALGLGARDGNARSRQMGRSGDLGHRAPGRARLSARLQPAARARLEGTMTVVIRPGQASPRRLARNLARRSRRARPRHVARRVAASAAAVARIVARGEPVYGINTGFGKLASVRIAPPISRRSSATSCSRTPPASASRRPSPTVRLMMALKLAAWRRAPRACGRDARPPRGDARARRDAGRALARLGRRLGRPRAARAYGRGDDRRRRGACRRPRRARSRTPSRRPGSTPLALSPRKGSRFSTARNSRPPTRSPACSRPRMLLALGPGRPARFRPTRRAARTRRSTRASTRCAAIAARSRSPAALRALLAGSAIRASHLTGDDRVQDPYCLRCQPQVMGACLDLLRQAAATLRDRGQRRLRQSADLRGRRTRRSRAATSTPSRSPSPPT